MRKEFQFQAQLTRDLILSCRRHLLQRRKTTAKSCKWFAANHGCWLAIEAHQKFS